MARQIRILAAAALVLGTALPAAGSVSSAGSAVVEEASPLLVAAKRRRRRPKPKPSETSVFEKNLPKAPALQERKGRRSVALLPLQAVEIPENLKVSIENDLLTEIDEAGDYTAVTPSDVRSDLTTLGDVHPAFAAPFEPDKCNGNAECLSIAGRYARAHYAIETRVSGVGGTVKIALRMFDTQSRKELARTADVVSENAKAKRARELHRLMVQLLRPKSFVGSLTVACDEPGAEVYLNDELLGKTPLKGAVRGLAAGPYILKVSKDGFSDVYQFVDVVYRKVSTYRVNMNENTIASELVQEESERGFGEVYVFSKSGEFDLRIDGDPRGKVPLEGAPLSEVAAGNRRLSLRYEDGDPIVEPIRVEAGRRTDVVVEAAEDGSYRIGSVTVVDTETPLPDGTVRLALDPTPGVFSAPEPGSESSWRTTGLVLGAAGVLGLVTGGYLSTVVARFDDEARSLEQDGTISDVERATEVNDKGQTAETQQFVAYGVGAALLATGVGLIVWDMTRTPEPEPRLSPEAGIDVSLAPLPGGGLLGLELRF